MHIKNKNIFYITRKYEDRFLGKDYSNLLNFINKKTNIDKNIIDMLYVFNILDKLISIDVEEDEYFTNINIPDNFSINHNFKSSQAYIFALLSLNKDYEIFFGTHYNYLKNKNNNIYVYSQYKFEDIEIQSSYLYEEKNIIPYEENILNDIEKELFKKSMTDQFTLLNSMYTFCTSANHQLSGKKFIFSSKFNPLKYSSYESLIETIDNFNNELHNLIFEFNEQNKIFFQRALTEIEIKNF